MNFLKGIELRNRDDVSIHHCNIQNFYGSEEWGACWGLKVWSTQVEPTDGHVFYKSLYLEYINVYTVLNFTGRHNLR